MLRLSKVRRLQRPASSLITPVWAACTWEKASLVLPERRNLSCITRGRLGGEQMFSPAKSWRAGDWNPNGILTIHKSLPTTRGPTTAYPSASHLLMPDTDQQHSQRSCFFLIPFLYFLRIYPWFLFLKFGWSLFSFPCSECVSIKTQAGYHPLGNCLLSLSYYYFSLWPCSEKFYVDYYFFFL